MRIIVCGGRDYEDRDTMRLVLVRFFGARPTIVHGACGSGADSLADELAHRMGYPVERHPADWWHEGRRAGPSRNARMARLGADLCIAFPGGRGTADMVRCAIKHGIPVHVVALAGILPAFTHEPSATDVILDDVAS